MPSRSFSTPSTSPRSVGGAPSQRPATDRPASAQAAASIAAAMSRGITSIPPARPLWRQSCPVRRPGPRTPRTGRPQSAARGRAARARRQGSPAWAEASTATPPKRPLVDGPGVALPAQLVVTHARPGPWSAPAVRSAAPCRRRLATSQSRPQRHRGTPMAPGAASSPRSVRQPHPVPARGELAAPRPEALWSFPRPGGDRISALFSLSPSNRCGISGSAAPGTARATRMQHRQNARQRRHAPLSAAYRRQPPPVPLRQREEPLPMRSSQA
jgi:hypothetical protein